MQPRVIEPVHPFAGLPFDFDFVVESTKGLDELRFVAAVQALCEGVGNRSQLHPLARVVLPATYF